MGVWRPADETRPAPWRGILRDYPRVRAICIGGIAPFVPLFYFMGSAVAYAIHLGQPSSVMTVLVGAMAVGRFAGGLWAKHGQKHGYLTGTVAGTVTIVSIPMWALLSVTSAIWLAIGVIVVIQVCAVATEIVLESLGQMMCPQIATYPWPNRDHVGSG